MARLNAGGPRQSGGIAGRISTRSGAAVARVPVMIVGDSPAHLDIAAVTNANGDYQFGDLTPGDYEIQANVRDRLRVQRVRVSAGELARLDFVTED